MARILIFLLSVSSLWSINAATSIIGINPNRLPLYDSSKDFTCLDGSKVVSFSSVNDDYCDCPDGSDEPGTSACPNGRFFCKNGGYLPILLPSSRVNDGICDCCDGSDEYGKEGLCGDNCMELGREYREQKKKEKEVFDQGMALREELSEQGKKTKEERLSELEDLQKRADEKKELAEKLQAHKETVESLESDAKAKHDKEWEETITKLKEERELKRANEAFDHLDADDSGSITVQELTSTSLLDDSYSEEGAKKLLEDKETVEKELFVSHMWNSTFKDIFNKSKPAEESKDDNRPSEQPPSELPPPIDDVDIPEAEKDDEHDDDDEKDLDSVTTPEYDEKDIHDDEDDDDDDDDDIDDEQDVAPPAPENRDDDDDLPSKPDYNEETKKLIAAADKARDEYHEVTKEKDDVLSKLADIDRLTKIDVGEHEEFFPLQGQCFEYSDREYTYKLCPFEKATQTSKSGSSEVSLGTWGEWSGNPARYSDMKYTNGLGCWNGPNRSTVVKLQCGTQNELVAVSEPNKCEYEFIFKTPASCHPDSFTHDEF